MNLVQRKACQNCLFIKAVKQVKILVVQKRKIIQKTSVIKLLDQTFPFPLF